MLVQLWSLDARRGEAESIRAVQEGGESRPRLFPQVLDAGLQQLGSICDALTAQLEREEGLATTRKRSDSHASEFIGPGKHKPKPDKK